MASTFFVGEGEQPADHLVHHGGVQAVALELAFAYGGDHARLLQQIEVVRDAGLADGEVISELPGREVALAQQLQDGALRGVVQGLEGDVHDRD